MTKAPSPLENERQETQTYHQNVDFTATDNDGQLSNFFHPTGVVKPV